MLNAVRLPLRAVANVAVPFALRSRGTSFADSVLRLIARVRQESISEPVIDYSRYPDGVAPSGPLAALIVSRFIRKNHDAINRTAALFDDDASRELLRQLFAFRALGPYHMRLPTRPEFVSDLAKASNARVADSRIKGLPSGVFDFEFDGVPIRAESTLTALVHGIFGRQYYFERDGVQVQVESGDIVIDAGGGFGETALIMASSAGPGGRIYSFEPIADHVEVFGRNLASNPELAGRVTVIPKAVGAESGKIVTFTYLGAGSREANSGEIHVETLTIDDLVESQQLPSVEFVKMDVEGAETRALAGAARTIRRFRPKLGISVYHSLSDLILLPQLVKEIEPSYRLYLDHHTVHAEETVLYAIADRN